MAPSGRSHRAAFTKSEETPLEVFQVNKVILQAAIRGRHSNQDNLARFLKVDQIPIESHRLEALAGQALSQGNVDILLREANPTETPRNSRGGEAY